MFYSHLVVKHADGNKLAQSVDFYYMANVTATSSLTESPPEYVKISSGEMGVQWPCTSAPISTLRISHTHFYTTSFLFSHTHFYASHTHVCTTYFTNLPPLHSARTHFYTTYFLLPHVHFELLLWTHLPALRTTHTHFYTTHIHTTLFSLLYYFTTHSYLVVRYADGNKVAQSVGFYYMANAGGRLMGTLVSGALYSYVDPENATNGIGMCVRERASVCCVCESVCVCVPHGHVCV